MLAGADAATLDVVKNKQISGQVDSPGQQI